MSALAVSYFSLGAAIFAEIIGTSLLTASQQFTKMWPTVGMAVCYLIAFYFLSISLRVIPVGIAYAIWSGVGVAAITMIGYLFFKQALDLPAVIGVTLIVLGVIVLNVFSKNIAH